MLIEKELQEIRLEIDRFKHQSQRASVLEAAQPLTKTLADPALPNLLEADSFYDQSLSKLLGDHFVSR